MNLDLITPGDSVIDLIIIEHFPLRSEESKTAS